jgi:hypothetical protein
MMQLMPQRKGNEKGVQYYPAKSEGLDKIPTLILDD